MDRLLLTIIIAVAVYYGVGLLSRLFGSEVRVSAMPFGRKRTRKNLSFDNDAIAWCANLLSIEKSALEKVLYDDVCIMYNKFKVKKHSGGHRIIAHPHKTLMDIQRTIYSRILSQVNIYPAATGFRKGMSIVDNVKPHLGKDDIIKTDIVNFFSSIKQDSIVKVFTNIGYPVNISKILAELCCLDERLPQGAPTSPSLSNVISYEMDKKLAFLSQKYGLMYTRYADDLTFSGNRINPELILPEIRKTVNGEGFYLQRKKTRYINKCSRKIITGISISSGKKLTIPKAKKREIRKNVYFVLTKGLAEHQKFIKSEDPVYLKRLICYLSFWKMVEPDNKYVSDSIIALRKLQA